MLKRILCFSIVLVCLSLSACTSFVNDPSLAFIDESLAYIDQRPLDDRLILEDPTLAEALKNTYQVASCIAYQAYVIDDEICFDYTFNAGVTKAEINTMLATYMDYIVRGPQPIGYSPYAMFDGYRALNRYTLRFFVDENLLLFKSYDKLQNQFVTYENTHLDVACRGVESSFYRDVVEVLQLPVMQSVRTKVINPITPYALFISIEHPKSALSENALKTYQQRLEDLAKRTHSLTKLAYVLEIRTNTNDVLSSTSYLIDQSKWIEGDWMNLDFFSMR